MLEEVLDIGFLRLGPGFDQLAPCLDLDPAGAEHLELVARLRAGADLGAAHADLPVDVTLFQPAPGLEPLVERIQHLDRVGGGVGIAEDGQLVAAPQDLHPQFLFKLGQVAVIFAAQVDQQAVVGKFGQTFDLGCGIEGRGQNRDSQAGLLAGAGPAAGRPCRLNERVPSCAPSRKRLEHDVGSGT